MAKAQVHLLPAARNTVMVVDDQSTSRAILEQVVRSLDERVVVEGFARPVDAVVWAARHVADLVLVDFMMPDMDGIELLREIRKRHPALPVIAMTGASSDLRQSIGVLMKTLGAAAVLEKPFSTSALIDAIEACRPDLKTAEGAP